MKTPDEIFNFAAEPWQGRAILLVDLDAFFASVEQLDHPEWRNKPVIVGSPSSVRGVVSTASYEARAFGVRSAMASSVAERLCPQAVWTPVHFDRYRQLSRQIMAFLHEETPYVQQVSIDEAFLDVSPSRINNEHPAAVAARIQQRVRDLGLSCSVGVATSKTVAKIASEQAKPKGLTVVYPGTERSFLADLPVREMSGIGAASESALKKLGIHTLGQLSQADMSCLKRIFGKNAELFRQRSLGIEDSLVEQRLEVKSISHELSFPVDLTERKELEDTILGLSEKVGRRLRQQGFAGKTITLKIRFGNRTLHTAQKRLELPTDNELIFGPECVSLLDELWTGGSSVRLLGVAMSSLVKAGGEEELPASAPQMQMGLFDDETDYRCDGVSSAKRAKLQALIQASDQVKHRFGDEALSFGRGLGT